MYYFEIPNTRKVTPVTTRHFYPLWPLLNPSMDEVFATWYERPYMDIDQPARSSFWKLQGDIIGSCCQ